MDKPYSNDDLRIVAEKWVKAHDHAHSGADLRHLAAGVIRLLDEDARIRPVFDLVCELQDSEQCEGHSTGDDCEQGEIEDKLFQLLATIRTDDGRTDPVERGEKRRGPAIASKREHVASSVDGCVSWCPACLENQSRCLNPDGSVKEPARG